MKIPTEIEEMHDWIVERARTIVPSEQHEPVVFLDVDGEITVTSIAEFFTSIEGKEFVAIALRDACSILRPRNVAFISEATLGTIESSVDPAGISAEDCDDHFDAVVIQIEVPGAVHTWSHRLDGEMPSRTMEPVGDYIASGSMGCYRFCLLPENQERESCPSN